MTRGDGYLEYAKSYIMKVRDFQSARVCNL
jgi:hypothetical protein